MVRRRRLAVSRPDPCEVESDVVVVSCLANHSIMMIDPMNQRLQIGARPRLKGWGRTPSHHRDRTSVQPQNVPGRQSRQVAHSLQPFPAASAVVAAAAGGCDVVVACIVCCSAA